MTFQTDGRNIMQYSDARKEIRTGDILAWKHEECDNIEDLKIQFVRIFTRSEYSHTGIAWVVGERVFVLEAVKPMVRIFPLSKLLPFYWIQMDKELTYKSLEKALSMVGYEYGEMEAIKGFFRRNDRENKITECAEYVRVVMMENESLPDGTDTPTHIVDDAMNLNHPMIKVTQ